MISTEDKYNLRRFIEAQETTYPTALKELQQGLKSSHWMWYIFPQVKGLGHSFNSRFYAISGAEEAAAYLENTVLGGRLREVSATIFNLPGDDAYEIFGGIDSHKLRSSMTLFDFVSPDDIFARVLDKFFQGRRDRLTLNILQKS